MYGWCEVKVIGVDKEKTSMYDILLSVERQACNTGTLFLDRKLSEVEWL